MLLMSVWIPPHAIVTLTSLFEICRLNFIRVGKHMLVICWFDILLHPQIWSIWYCLPKNILYQPFFGPISANHLIQPGGLLNYIFSIEETMAFTVYITAPCPLFCNIVLRQFSNIIFRYCPKDVIHSLPKHCDIVGTEFLSHFLRIGIISTAMFSSLIPVNKGLYSQ